MGKLISQLTNCCDSESLSNFLRECSLATTTTTKLLQQINAKTICHATKSHQSIVLIPRILKFAYYVCITSAFCSNILVVAQTTILSVLGASLALRGPDGSMMTATDGLYHERALVFRNFGYGLVLTVGSVVLCVWLHLHWEASVICCLISILTLHKMRSTYYRIVKKFDFDEAMTVDLSDFFSGPAAIQAVPMRRILEEGARGLGIHVGKNRGTGAKSSFDVEDGLTEEEEAFVRGRQKSPNGGHLNGVERFLTV